MNHLLDGDLDKHRGVIGNLVFDAVREALGQPRHGVAHGLGGIQGIGTRLRVDTEGSVALTVERGHQRVVLRAQLHPGDIAQGQSGAAVVTAQDDSLELLGIDQTALGGHRVGERLRLVERFLTEAAGRELRVLLTDGVDHVGRRQAVLRQLVRTQPDTHGVVLGAELGDVAHAGQALDLVDDVDQRVVADFQRRLGAIRGVHRHHLQDV